MLSDHRLRSVSLAPHTPPTMSSSWLGFWESQDSPNPREHRINHQGRQEGQNILASIVAATKCDSRGPSTQLPTQVQSVATSTPDPKPLLFYIWSGRFPKEREMEKSLLGSEIIEVQMEKIWVNKKTLNNINHQMEKVSPLLKFLYLHQGSQLGASESLAAF